MDAKNFDAAGDGDYTFKANYDMVSNVFRGGLSRNNQNFKNLEEPFPFEQDKLQSPLRSFTITKLYDAQMDRWKTPQDVEDEKELTRR